MSGASGLAALPLLLGALALVLGGFGVLRRAARASLPYFGAGALLVGASFAGHSSAPPGLGPPLVAVSFASDPSGAELFLGVRALGRTPLTVALPRGVYVAYRLEPGPGVLLPGRFASYEGSLRPARDTELSIWLDRLSGASSPSANSDVRPVSALYLGRAESR